MKQNLFLTLALCSNLVLAQPVPDAGLRAEVQGQWTEAVEIYKQALQLNPAQAHLWERIADIRATQLKAPARAAEALREAVKYTPNDARLQHKLSQAYAAAQDNPNALAAIERALELDPKNLEYLRTRAILAAARGNYALALDSQQRILALAPDDSEALLGIARIHYWRGQTTAAAAAYRDYLSKQPNAAAALMEYIVVVAELGDYAHAMELLQDYRQRFGDNAAYRKQKARVLARAGRPTSALAIVSELEPSLRNDHELSYTRSVALHHAHRPREALASLAEFTRLAPGGSERKDSTDLARFIRTPLRSNAKFDYGYAAGSDDVTIRHAGVRGEYVINPETRLFGGGDRQRISTRSGSGFEKPDGGTAIDYDRAWLGLQHRYSPKFSLDAQIGSGTAEGNGQFIYEVGADIQPIDELGLRLARRQDLHAVSPLAAKRAIERRANTLNASWTPDLHYTVAGRVAYDTFSDGNDRWEAELAPRRAFLRTQHLNLDLGVSGRWFGFDHDPRNGYYAPSRYERYALTAFAYWKISDDDGVSVAFSYGPSKDNTLSGFRNGGDIVAQGFFGLYRDWFLDVKAAVGNYGGGATGGYRSRSFEIGLTRRF